MKELTNIKYWIFDLDNTLYSGQTKIFSEVDKRMSAYISKKLNIDSIKAKKMMSGDNIITGGMIPKINTCIDAVNNGVKGVVIIDGRIHHSILFELLSDKGVGTLIRE